MRLTLRTMLAYLDDVLEGPDAKELEQKIEESKFASDLVHRIRSSVRRLRLGAPKVTGKGMGADANSVAEYLDNTMPPEQVPELEKVCLESDVQLAEVAACHQVLTLVLGEPAAVDPAIRDRMYRIGHPEVAAPHPAPAHEPIAAVSGARSSGGEAAGVDPAGNGLAARSSAVEPKRASKARAATPSSGRSESAFPFKSLAITLLLGFGVSAVALRAIAPFDTNHPLWRLFSGSNGSQQVAQQPVVEATTGEPSLTPAPESTTPETVPGKATTESPAAAAESTEPAALEAPVPASPPQAAPADANGKEQAAPVPALAVPTPSVSATPVDRLPDSEKPALVKPMPTVNTAPPDRVTVPAPAVIDSAPSLKPPEVSPAPVNVARYISEGQVLARMDAEKNAWMVLPPDTPLNAGEQLLSLPTYRPQVLVAPTVKLTLAGEAFVKLHVPDATNSPRVTIDFGRVVLVPVGEMGNSVQVNFAGREGQLTFADVEAVIATEVRPYLPSGADPMKTTSNVIVQMWATAGGAEWREREQPPVKLSAGQRLQFIDENPVVIAEGASPDWIDGKNLSDIDRRASQELYKFLTTDRPLALSLLEQTNYRQVEVRALSCRSLCYLDIFEPAIAALGDSQHKAYWYSQLGAIQSTLPFGPETVAKLHADLDKRYGEDAEKIYRLIHGYSPDQLAAGGATELVDSLENDAMAVRVVASIILQRITDKTQLFHPENRPEQEKSKVIRWRKLLEEGQIVYKNPPSPLPPTVAPTTTDPMK